MAADAGRLFIVLFGGLVEGNVRSCLRSRSVEVDVNLSLTPPLFLPHPAFPFLLQSSELVKAYPPFVNFFEMSKETIVRCEKLKPRFHAFLKVGTLLQSSTRLDQSNEFNFFFLFRCLCCQEVYRLFVLSYLQIGLGGFLNKDLGPIGFH